MQDSDIVTVETQSVSIQQYSPETILTGTAVLI